MTASNEPGRLVGIGRKARKRAPVEELERVRISADGGLEGDGRGRFPDRAVTVLSREAWAAALADLDPPIDLPWTVRRANLLVEGVRLPRAPGGVLRVGAVELEVTSDTWPCLRMEEQQAGLLEALSPDWRGGVSCRVRAEGEVALGDAVEVLADPPERRKPRLS